MLKLPTPDSISNYFKSTLSCQTTAKKAASVFLNSDERPEHPRFSWPHSHPENPLAGSRAQLEMHTELGKTNQGNFFIPFS